MFFKRSIAVENRGIKKWAIVLYYTPTFLGRLLCLSKYNQRFVGDGNAWYEVPTAERCPPKMELWLSQLIRKAQAQDYNSWLDRKDSLV
jgi:hypothetical protein